MRLARSPSIVDVALPSRARSIFWRMSAPTGRSPSLSRRVDSRFCASPAGSIAGTLAATISLNREPSAVSVAWLGERSAATRATQINPIAASHKRSRVLGLICSSSESKSGPLGDSASSRSFSFRALKLRVGMLYPWGTANSAFSLLRLRRLGCREVGRRALRAAVCARTPPRRRRFARCFAPVAADSRHARRRYGARGCARASAASAASPEGAMRTHARRAPRARSRARG